MTDYTAAQLKTMILDQINKVKGLDPKAKFDPTDADEAYDEAVRECGFECPASSDADKSKKYQWLINRMRRFFIGRLLEQYILRFNVADMQGNQIPFTLEKILARMDEQFLKAKEGELAGLFVTVTDLFGDEMALAISTGIIQDRVGYDIEERTSE